MHTAALYCPAAAHQGVNPALSLVTICISFENPFCKQGQRESYLKWRITTKLSLHFQPTLHHSFQVRCAFGMQSQEFGQRQRRQADRFGVTVGARERVYGPVFYHFDTLRWRVN